ncbi:Ubiquitin-conjugating enzyme E2 S [Leucoagaricus sp. SymC.cos]|nr:Ubiquitin-conjugating enzyme E2 S [Leucoagaricus sp. SymC.cos]
MRELTELRKNPPEGIRVQTNEEDMLNVIGIIEGPEGTPYAGGYFKVKFKFTDEFPAAPPKCWFATKIFHPNVSSAGEICVNTLKKDWQSRYGIGHILVTVKCLLIYPNPESALDEEAGKLLLEDYESYCSRAKLITSVHATPRVKPVEFNDPSPASAESSSAASSSTTTASTSKSTLMASTPTSAISAPSTTTSTPPTSTTTSVSSAPLFPLPVVTRKSASPVPQPHPLKITLASEKEGAGKDKDRHPSPSPLATADANVGGKTKPAASIGLSIANNTMPTGATKAVKRAATGSVATNAEKRKKALKRL